MTRRVFAGLSLVLDAMLVNAAFLVAYFLWFRGAPPTFNFGPFVSLWPVLTLVYLAAGYVNGLYSPERTQSAWTVGRAAFLAVTVGTTATAAISFFAGTAFFSFSRAVILIAWALQIALLVDGGPWRFGSRPYGGPSSGYSSSARARPRRSWRAASNIAPPGATGSSGS